MPVLRGNRNCHSVSIWYLPKEFVPTHIQIYSMSELLCKNGRLRYKTESNRSMEQEGGKNMTKRFCDLCGKEIHNLQETYRVCVESNASICASNPDIVDVIVDVGEICPACAKRIHQTVQELKQEG